MRGLLRWVPAIAALAVLAVGMGSAGGATGGMHSCGDKPGQYAYNIKADFACKNAFRIVRKWNGSNSVDGFHCGFRSTGIEQGKVHCKTKHRRVRWVTAV